MDGHAADRVRNSRVAAAMLVANLFQPVLKPGPGPLILFEIKPATREFDGSEILKPRMYGG